MFCPGCGDKLEKVGRELTCVRGQMGLSQQMERRLTACFILKSVTPHESRLSIVVGGKWFCPGCGTSAREENGFIRCQQCGLSLNEFIYPLVELHPHAGRHE